jgi:RNA polymerase sigma-70 factor (ECF subfamily)
VLASLIGLLGDFDLAEEATQEAFAIAAERWPRDGTPRNPGAWLTTTARNRAIDRLRRTRVLAEKTKRLELSACPRMEEGIDAHEMDDTVIPDERLELVFTCCHPALATEAQVALTLHALGGLSTEEIARSFLVSPEAMKRRLTRAKSKIKTAGIPFTVPAEHLLPERLAAVLAVVYLVFNQGYSSPGEHAGLAREAIRLGGVLAALMPDEPEVHGLIALMLLSDSRRDARSAGDELVLLADQDRSLWNHAQIARARLALERALALRGQGPYVLQAAIASLQVATAPDWARIEALYRELAELTGSPVVELNRAVAVAEGQGPAAALAIVDRLASSRDGELDDYQYLHSTRAELLRRLGRGREAQAAYERALELAGGERERRFLRRRLAEL